jgi:threonyl-tRNA synthetase
MNIKLKDGTIIEREAPVTAADIAASISEGLARAACAAKVDGVLVDLSTRLDGDCALEIVTFRDDEGRDVYRHTAAHILAQAVKKIYPTVKLAIGPTTKDGFYYDFEFSSPISRDDFAAIEKEMQAIIKADFPIERIAVTKKQAVTQMQGFNEPYKLEIIEALPKGEKITLYKHGNFIDLCKGPHLPSTGRVKFFTLTNLAGAYWRGNENNKMLTRIYGAAFEKKSELTEYIEKLEDAKRRDHNKLGRELGYFMTEEKIGQGLPLLMPKGAKLLQILQRFVEDEEEKRGYKLTRTPVMAKSDLYKISGHWDHYRDKMFILGDPQSDAETEVMALRPMTCPFQYYIYKNGLKSYRDLPVRYAETSPLFRKEASGEMHGLIRVRQFTLSDGHIMCTPEQLETEFKDCLSLSYRILDSIGLRDAVTFRFSRRDPLDKEKYIDDSPAWERAEGLMKRILDGMGLSYVEAIGEAAFYGPKLDFQVVNVFGKEDTIITIQVDMFLAENFDMSYIDADGEKKRPYIIHRSSLGCYERTIAMLIEKYAGALPVWFAPEQVRLLSLTERNAPYAAAVAQKLAARGIRVSTDGRNEKIGYKIREAQLEKIPYMLIVGDKEAEASAVSVRCRRLGDLGQMPLDSFLDKISAEIDGKVC